MTQDPAPPPGPQPDKPDPPDKPGDSGTSPSSPQPARVVPSRFQLMIGRDLVALGFLLVAAVFVVAIAFLSAASDIATVVAPVTTLVGRWSAQCSACRSVTKGASVSRRPDRAPRPGPLRPPPWSSRRAANNWSKHGTTAARTGTQAWRTSNEAGSRSSASLDVRSTDCGHGACRLGHRRVVGPDRTGEWHPDVDAVCYRSGLTVTLMRGARDGTTKT